MRMLISDDDAVSRHILKCTLSKWGHDVVVTSDGDEAWDALHEDDAPRLAIVDWMMPRTDGIELCKRIRNCETLRSVYVVMLTSKTTNTDLVAALEAGADDYIAKPFNSQELRARLNVGVRVVRLQAELASRIGELEDALANVKQLQGLLPICSYCKRVRDDRNYWEQVDTYISKNSDVEVSHSICPPCLENELDKLKS